MPGRYKLQCVTTLLVIAVEIFIYVGPRNTKGPVLDLPKAWTKVDSRERGRVCCQTIDHQRREDRRPECQRSITELVKQETYALICGNSTLTHRTPHENYMSKKKSSQPLGYPVGQGNINSLFVSGRKLSEEYQYILERARFGKWTSTTLQNPSLLLKRQEHSETTVTSKRLKGATAFDLTPKSIHLASARMRARAQMKCWSSQGHSDSIPAYGK